MHPIIERQIAAVKELEAGAAAVDNPDGSVWVIIPNVPLPPGWSLERTTVCFVAPLGFPQARPDCFFADGNLRLASGGMPTNSNLQQPPYQPSVMVWFSWHVSTWDPNSDSLLTYLNVIKKRFREVR